MEVDPIVGAWEIEPVRDSDLIGIPDRFECATMTTPTSHHKNKQDLNLEKFNHRIALNIDGT
jgi:hypothetical protein